MPSNLPEEQKENWTENEIVMPDNTNSWGRAINTLSKAVPLYSACGNVYTATYTNNVYNLTPLSFTDNTSNVTVDSYVDGMSVIFQCPTNNLANCSVNVNSLGVKTIKTIDNVNLPAGKLNSGVFVELKYDKTNDCFKFQQDFNKANKDLDNLTEVGEKHFLNKSQITNCLLEVPQKIKLELNDGVLTLKAGSKVIVPNGFEADGTTPKFDYVTVESDISYAWTESVSIPNCYWFFTNNIIYPVGPNITVVSGSTQPTITTQIGFWYDTTNNLIKETHDTGSSWTTNNTSLPFGIASLGNNVITSIDQVFNGMGYIGSTVWVDKGVKGLIPNGRNEDGTLNNIEFTVGKVRKYTNTGARNNSYLALSANDNQGVGRVNKFEVSDDISQSSASKVIYSPTLNKNIISGGTEWKWAIIGQWSSTSTSPFNVTSLQPKQPFRAADYNDFRSEVDGKVSKSGDTMSGDLHVPRLIVDNRDTYDSIAMNTGPTDAYGNRIANYTCFMGDGYWTKVQSVWHPTNNYGSQGLLFCRADNGAIYNLCIDSNGNVIHNDHVAHQIKETYVNGTSWYRVWSDGWCEQGGYTEFRYNTPVTLLKNYRNTNWSIQTTSSTDTGEAVSIQIISKTTWNFTPRPQRGTGNGANQNGYWYACGY